MSTSGPRAAVRGSATRCPARRQRDRHQFFNQEVLAKRLGLLHDLVPRAVRVAVLVNSANASITETTLRELQKAAPALGLQIQRLNASTIGEIDAVFATVTRERPDALFVGPDAFFASRRVQFVTLTAVNRIPAAYTERDVVAAGGLMSYGTDLVDAVHQVGVYTGRILKGAKPADLPVVQSALGQAILPETGGRGGMLPRLGFTAARPCPADPLQILPELGVMPPTLLGCAHGSV